MPFWLVRSTSDQAVRVRALAGNIVLCSWAKRFTLIVLSSPPRGGGEGVLPVKLGGGVQAASQNLALFMTKICNFSYPIYDLTKKLVSYL